MRRILMLAALALAPLAAPHAQQVQPPPVRRDRAALEERFRERLEQVLRERLALTDAQFARVVEVGRRLEGERRDLIREERAVRRDMREALAAGDDPATQERVASLLERAMRVQRRRLELVETEQRELAASLTPVQRAKYLGLQEQLRMRAEELRRAAEPDAGIDDAPGRPGWRGRAGRGGIPRRPPDTSARIP